MKFDGTFAIVLANFQFNKLRYRHLLLVLSSIEFESVILNHKVFPFNKNWLHYWIQFWIKICESSCFPIDLQYCIACIWGSLRISNLLEETLLILISTWAYKTENQYNFFVKNAHLMPERPLLSLLTKTNFNHSLIFWHKKQWSRSNFPMNHSSSVKTYYDWRCL